MTTEKPKTREEIDAYHQDLLKRIKESPEPIKVTGLIGNLEKQEKDNRNISCTGFGFCNSCMQSIPILIKGDLLYICSENDRLQYRCDKCNVRTTSSLTEPRTLQHLCVKCFKE